MQQIPAFYFDAEQLAVLAKERSAEFRQAHPFPHLVLEDFLPRWAIERLVAEFPGPDDIEWASWGPGRTRRLAESKLEKLGQSAERHFGPFTRHFIAQLNSATFIQALEALTGIRGIIVDPSYNGCGLHSTGAGGRLMIHTDTNRHPHSGHVLHQVLNLIVYLNLDWREEWGGHLELWTREREPALRIAPLHNRAVLFSTGTRSYHGHPEPLACPPGRRRNSIAVYYYSLDRLPSEDYEGMQRAVRWVPTGEDDRAVAQHAAARAEAFLSAAHGSVLRIASQDLPVELRGADDALRFELFQWSRLPAEQREALLAQRLRPLAPPELGGAAAAFLEAYQPFAAIAPAEGAALGAPGSLLACFRRDDSSVHLACAGRAQLLFTGYLDEMLAMLSGRLLTQVLALRAG